MPALAQFKCRTVSKEFFTKHTIDRHIRVPCIIWDINPESYSHSICSINFRKSHIQRVEACFVNLSKVTLYSKSIITVTNLSGACIYYREITKLILTIVPVVSIRIFCAAIRTLWTILRIICFDSPSINIVVLKIIGDFCALAQSNICSNGKISYRCSKYARFSLCTLRSRSESKTIQCTK